MKRSTLLNTAFAIAAGYLGSTACVARECTGEEQQEVGATGADECTTYTPPVQHRGDAVSTSEEYTAGTNLFINGDFRNLEIEAFPSGGTGEVEVTYTPVVDLAEGRSESEVENTLEELEVTVSQSGGTINVNAARSGDSNVAAILQVRIPDDFDGDIKIEQDGAKNDGGEAELGFLANTQNLEVDLNASGQTISVDGPDLLTAVINVNGFWDIKTSVFESPDFGGARMTTENGDITTGFAVVPTGNDVLLTAEDGDITISLPNGGDYTMTGASTDFSFSAGVPPTCDEATNGGGGSMTCGAGSPSDEFSFQLEAGGAIDVASYND
jgi:hypothetical protein